MTNHMGYCDARQRQHAKIKGIDRLHQQAPATELDKQKGTQHRPALVQTEAKKRGNGISSNTVILARRRAGHGVG